MKIIRAPVGLTASLPDYPFESRFLSVPADPTSSPGQTLRMHYVEAGPADGPPVVFLHGNPSWSYLWRTSIQAVADLGFRAIALDLVGMGMSDRPSEIDDYSVARHVEWTRSALIDGLDLQGVILVLHDWDGILGLRVLGAHPDRVAGVAISKWKSLVRRIPGARDLPHVILEGGGHFLQEDIPEASNAALVAWLEDHFPTDRALATRSTRRT